HGFEIERSLDKTSWATIGFREGKGTTSEPQQYSYSDNLSYISTSKLFYRLKQLDFNGTFEYSKIVEVEITPTNFSLAQNYPNPFNPSTSIQYAISSGQLVTLKVYDVLGKEIATLVNEEKSVGSYEIGFNASHLASGIYYYQLRTGDYVETKKMILLK
ncbi:MAG: T9SS type A sorting domain-containing protein, partial [Ignavibacteriaceae bacterium]